MHITHIFVVEFYHRRRLIKGHVILCISGVVKFLYSIVMKKIVLLFKLFKTDLELSVLLLLLKVQYFSNNILKEALICYRFVLLSQNLVKHILDSY